MTAPAVQHAAHGAPAPAAPDGATAFEPVLVGFTCNWCSYRAADLAGTARTKYPPNIRLVRLMCSGRLDPTFVLKALASGADGVLVSGCHPGDCHYITQNLSCLRRYHLLERMLDQLGLEPGRIKLFWASAAEGVPLANAIAEMVEDVRRLGPLDWPQEVPVERGDLDEIVAAAVTAAAGAVAAAAEEPPDGRVPAAVGEAEASA